MTAKLSKFCSIHKYIQTKDPKLGKAIEDLCAIRLLARSKFSNGITFLMPGAAARQVIVDKAYSAKPEDALVAIKAHIINEDLAKTVDFKKMSADIGTAGGVKLEVQKIDDKLVTLKGADGALVIEIDNGFKPLVPPDRESRIHVWSIVSGAPPITGPEFKQARRAPKEKGMEKKHVDGGAELLNRQQLWKNIMAAFKKSVAAGTLTTNNPFATNLVGLLNHVKARDPAAFAGIIGRVSTNVMASLFIMLEPYKTSGTPFIQDNLIYGWNGANVFKNVEADLNALIAEYKWPEGIDSKRYTDEVRAVGEEIISSPHSDMFNLPKLVIAAENRLIDERKVGTLDDVISIKAAQMIGSGQRALWQDMITMILAVPYNAIIAGRKGYSITDLDNITHNYTGTDMARDLSAFCDSEFLKTAVSAKESNAYLMKFIMSPNFMYVGRAMIEYTTKYTGSGDPDDMEPFNPVGESSESLKNTTTIQDGGIDNHTRETLKTYKSVYGEMPTI